MSEQEEPVIRDEEKLLIIERPMFESDARRHFVGVVETCDGEVARIRGHAFVYDAETSGFVRRKSQRTRIVRIDNSVIVLVPPSDLNLNTLKYESPNEAVTLVDGTGFQMELSGFSCNG